MEKQETKNRRQRIHNKAAQIRAHHNRNPLCNHSITVVVKLPDGKNSITRFFYPIYEHLIELNHHLKEMHRVMTKCPYEYKIMTNFVTHNKG